MAYFAWRIGNQDLHPAGFGDGMSGFENKVTIEVPSGPAAKSITSLQVVVEHLWLAGAPDLLVRR
jgi:hypothetical protein